MEYQPVSGYFMRSGFVTAYIVGMYEDFLKILKIFLHTIIWYQVFLSNTNNFETEVFDQ